MSEGLEGVVAARTVLSTALMFLFAGALIGPGGLGIVQIGPDDPIVGTYQGVWPGIQIQEDGHAKAGPTGSAWVDTNTGFVRAARALGPAGALR